MARQGGLEYLPIDVSRSAMEQSAERLLHAFPELTVTAFVADYQAGLRAVRGERVPPGVRTLALFLGSTIGNLDPGDRIALLREIRAVLRPGDGLLLGTDLRKPESVLLPAYDDALGVTAAFNLNLLSRINRELGGGFDLGSFRHRARWNRELGRIEMHLESLREQTVSIQSLGLEVRFAAGETIHTESSYKFEPAQVAEMAQAGGFALRRTWTDRGGRFASNLLTAVRLIYTRRHGRPVSRRRVHRRRALSPLAVLHESGLSGLRDRQSPRGRQGSALRTLQPFAEIAAAPLSR